MDCMDTELFTAEREWTVDGIPVLTARLSLPRPVDQKSRIGKRIDRFYQLQSRSYLRYCEKLLFPASQADYRQALALSSPLPLNTAELTCRVTCAQSGVLSVSTLMRECIGGRRNVMQRGDTWDLRSGYPLPLSAFFPKRYPIRKTLLKCAETEIRRRQEQGISLYHDAWQQELRRAFNRENFYLTPDGLRFFWQMGSIAPPMEGIPTFCLPFSEDGCRWPTDELLR